MFCLCPRPYQGDLHLPGCLWYVAPQPKITYAAPQKCTCGADKACEPYPAPGHADYCDKDKP